MPIDNVGLRRETGPSLTVVLQPPDVLSATNVLHAVKGHLLTTSGIVGVEALAFAAQYVKESFRT